MAWNKWLKEKRFTLFRSAIIQEQFIQCIMDHTTGGKILETGFGFGTTLELLRDIGYSVGGFDLEEIAIKRAEQRYPKLNGSLYVGNILDKSCYHDDYETIIHQGVLEHFEDSDIISILKLQYSKCKQIVFDVPNSLRKNVEDEGDGTRFETPYFWETILKKSGLKFKRFGRNYDYNNDLLPKKLLRYDSELMKRVGRSSIFVVKGELK